MNLKDHYGDNRFSAALDNVKLSSDSIPVLLDSSLGHSKPIIDNFILEKSETISHKQQKRDTVIDIPQTGLFALVKDLPNLCSLLGLFSAVLGIYFAIMGNYPISIIGILWAVLFDWYDGIIARKLKNRTEVQGIFGGQLDSLIDIVSFGVFPAILLLSYASYSVWFVPGAFVVIATSAVRLSYFNVYGLIDSKTYKGLSLDNNVLILAMAFIFESYFEHATFSFLIYSVLMILSAFNLSSISTPKFGGRWVYVLFTYVIVLTAFFGWLSYVKA
ncbi:MAG: CDP-alcohol phosphatidyltransferase family protein [Reichenbachiella sp.]